MSNWSILFHNSIIVVIPHNSVFLFIFCFDNCLLLLKRKIHNEPRKSFIHFSFGPFCLVFNWSDLVLLCVLVHSFIHPNHFICSKIPISHKQYTLTLIYRQCECCSTFFCPWSTTTPPQHIGNNCDDIVCWPNDNNNGDDDSHTNRFLYAKMHPFFHGEKNWIDA